MASELEQRAAELEALGLGIAPGLAGGDRSELVERVEIGAGQPCGAPAGDRSDRPLLSVDVVDGAVD